MGRVGVLVKPESHACALAVLSSGSVYSAPFALVVSFVLPCMFSWVCSDSMFAVFFCCFFHTTSGLAHNKLLAKLCSNMHKPNAQTVLPLNKVERVFHTLPVERVRGWGGKFGVKIMEKLGVSTVGETTGQLLPLHWAGGRDGVHTILFL